MRFKKNTRFKCENRYLTLRRQLPLRDAECYHKSGWGDTDVSLFYLDDKIELLCSQEIFTVFRMLNHFATQSHPSEYRWFREERLFMIKNATKNTNQNIRPLGR